MKCPRVLLICEAANPEWSSVPLIGWSLSQALGAVANTHLVTQIRNKEAIERAGIEPRNFTAIDSERTSGTAHRIASILRGGEGKGWTTMTAAMALTYPAFERHVWRQFAGRIEAGEFDLVHRITPLTPTAPSPLAARCSRAGVPFILGPLNGGLIWPPGFRAERQAEREWLSRFRWLHKLLPGYRSTRRLARAIIVASRATFEQLPKRYHSKCVYLPENGIDPDLFPTPLAPFQAPPLRVAFLGRIVPYKGLHMLIEAMAPLIRDGRALLDVIGDGPQRPAIEALIDRLGVRQGVTMAGWVEHRLVHDRLARSHVLGVPSIREFGGGAVLEAMASGVVPMIVDYGGPAELVTADDGIRLPLGSRRSIVDGLRQALDRLAASPVRIAEMRRAGRDRVSAWFTWRRKAEQVREIYGWVLGERSSKPDFGMPLGSPGWETVHVERTAGMDWS